MSHYKEELLSIVIKWPIELLNNYIQQLEARLVCTQELIRELKAIRKRKTKKTHYETGVRDGH